MSETLRLSSAGKPRRHLRQWLIRICLGLIVGGYSLYLADFSRQFQNPPERARLLRPKSLAYLSMAPVESPVVLVLTTSIQWPHLGGRVGELWLSYLIPLLAVLLIPRNKWGPALVAACVVTFMLVPWTIGSAGYFEASPLVGKPAPDFVLRDLDGVRHRLSDEKGRVLFLEWWSVTCPPCKLEMAELTDKLANDRELAERGLRIWTITNDYAETAAKFMAANKPPMTVLLDPQQLLVKGYEVRGLPTSVLIGRDGGVRKVFAGYHTGEDAEIRRLIDQALK